MGIGAALVGVGSFVTAGLASGVVAGAIGGAIVGAAIGGLTSALTGGNIMQGMLFGAVGGAVTGGVAAWAGGAGAAAEGGISAATTTEAQATIAAEGVGWGPTVNAATTTSISEGLEAAGGALLTETAKDTALEVGASFLKDAAMGYFENEAAADQREWESKQAELAHQRNMEMAQLQANLATGRGGGGGDALAYKAAMARIAEDRRQYDVARQDVLQARKTRGSAIAGALGGYEPKRDKTIVTPEKPEAPAIALQGPAKIQSPAELEKIKRPLEQVA